MVQKFLAVTVISLLSGCATTGDQSPAEGLSKAEKKISMSIGREPNNFKIVSSREIEAPTGYNGTQYTVKTNDGATFKCEILEPSGLGQVASWGMASGAGAMCTNFTQGSNDMGKTNKESCNALLRAAGKC